MLIAGIVCLVLAAVAGGIAWWQHRKHEELTAVETSTCGQMRQLADAATTSAGPGVFRQRCEIVGVAQPAYVGTVKGPQTGRECVWYRTKVTHHYYDWEWETRGGERRRERKRKTRTLQDDKSDVPFTLDDGTGQVVVHPEKADIDEPHEVLDEMDLDLRDSNPTLLEQIGFSFDRPDDSIGYKREEWVIPVGTRLFVQGEITDEDGSLRLRKPEKGSFRVSTRSEAELLKGAESGRKWSGVAAAVLGVAGLVLVVVGLIA
jgi:hypothetical protein